MLFAAAAAVLLLLLCLLPVPCYAFGCACLLAVFACVLAVVAYLACLVAVRAELHLLLACLFGCRCCLLALALLRARSGCACVLAVRCLRAVIAALCLQCWLFLTVPCLICGGYCAVVTVGAGCPCASACCAVVRCSTHTTRQQAQQRLLLCAHKKQHIACCDVLALLCFAVPCCLSPSKHSTANTASQPGSRQARRAQHSVVLFCACAVLCLCAKPLCCVVCCVLCCDGLVCAALWLAVPLPCR